MSAPEPPTGSTPTSTAAPPKTIVRRRRTGNPLVTKPSRPAARPPPQTPRPQQQNGLNQKKQDAPQEPPLDDEFEDIPIISTPRVLAGGLRHHVLRFLPNVSASVQEVDLLNEKHFARPIRFHRRDPRANNMNQLQAQAEAAAAAAAKEADEKERERLEAIKAERRAEREAAAAVTAPGSKKDQPPKKNRFGKKFESAKTYSDAQEKKKSMTIKYEEALPWHIEDFDDRNVWRGTYETALSDTNVVLIKDASGYRMVPLEKWYKFTPKNQFQGIAYEEAEARMKKGAKDPFMMIRDREQQHQLSRMSEAQRGSFRGVFARSGERTEQRPQARVKGEDAEEDDDEKPEIAADIDDIDFNYDEDFADDEEGPELVGADEREQAKETDDKVKREMREAPVFELREEKDFDAEEEERKRKEAQERKHRKRVEKALMRREKNFQYEEDSDDDNPFASDGDSEDSEIERQKEEEAKQEEEKKAAEAKAGPGKPGDKAASGATTKGTSTPLATTKQSKTIDPLKKLKRPGSPLVSDASGNESSAARKKSKKRLQGSGLAESSSLAAPRPNRPFKSGAGSDGGAGSGSEVELSESGRIKNGKKRGPPTGSPEGSRPGSPGAVSNKKPKTTGPLPEWIFGVAESLVPAEGIRLKNVVSDARLVPYRSHPDFTKLFKQNFRYDNQTHMLFPKGSKPGEGGTPTN